MSDLRSLVSALADRGRPRTEAMVQADVRRLLLEAPLGLDEDQVVVLEAPVEGLRRIDVEVGYTVIEVKKDLRLGRVRADAEIQLAGYVHARALELGQRYVGILTDGSEWRAYYSRDDALVEVAALVVSQSHPDVDELLVWLEGVLATKQGLRPTPSEIAMRLGAASSSHALDRETLNGLYAAHRRLPSVQLKRLLWSRLLTSALGAQFQDSDELFLEHTLLVNSAEIIAHAVLGLQVTTLPSDSLLRGHQFEQAQISGVVEADFFDWVLEVPGGDSFIRTIARRLARFDWGNVDHDVLKIMYESVISAETRRRLGEYYTPEWLAEQMVATAVTDPLRQHVLDPACGSGTFLFHSVRIFLAAADEHELTLADALGQLTDHVLGVDLHPVAVAFARVTYLLAIGRRRLTDPTRGPITVPVYLGDSMQWQQRLDLLTADHLVIPVDGEGELFASELRFPDHLLADSGQFDRLVTELVDLASHRSKGDAVPNLTSVFSRLAIHPSDQSTIAATFDVLCRLHDEGRDHIWGYYVRNLARPLWLSRAENRVDVLIGNPPWLAYRHMGSEMQRAFRAMCSSRGLWQSSAVATNQDLSALFVTRTVQLYLHPEGRFAFVMPNAALDRQQFAGFRTGDYADPVEPTIVAFTLPWDLRRLRPHFFPRAASVIFGGRRRVGDPVAPMPIEAEEWIGRLVRANGSWHEVSDSIKRKVAAIQVGGEHAKSRYQTRFAQGASVVPRVLFVVEDQAANPLGLAAGGRAIRSVRSAYEKSPWRELATLEGVVETEFVRSLYLGENVLPYRVLSPAQCVVPWDGSHLMDGSSQRIDRYPRLAAWWRNAERQWVQNRSSERLSLLDQLDFRHKFRNQFAASAHRVVYSKAGMHLAAARITDATAIVDHTLYWGVASSQDEALYLCAILNSPRVTALVRPLMSYGKDERHIDMAVWRLPIPLYNADREPHRRLAQLGGQAESEIARLDIDERKHFSALRRQIREYLSNSLIGREIDILVDTLLFSGEEAGGIYDRP